LGGVAAQRILEYGPDSGETILGELRDMFEPDTCSSSFKITAFPNRAWSTTRWSKRAARLNLPLVASNDVHFMNKEDGKRRSTSSACARPDLRRSRAAAPRKLRDVPEEPGRDGLTFSALPQAIDNTLLVTEMCSGLKLDWASRCCPHFKVPEGYDLDGYFRHVSLKGLEQRLGNSRRWGRSSTLRSTISDYSANSM
jgi:DNA polymerase-3 subunit alpha